jgi:hypothetical protein
VAILIFEGEMHGFLGALWRMSELHAHGLSSRTWHEDLAAASAVTSFGVAVMGRNESDRLKRCLSSLCYVAGQ